MKGRRGEGGLVEGEWRGFDMRIASSLLRNFMKNQFPWSQSEKTGFGL